LLAGDSGDLHARAERRIGRFAVMAGGLLLLGTLFSAVAQASAAADLGLLRAFGQPVLDLLTQGRFATIWWPRLALTVIAVAIVAWRGLDGVWSDNAMAIVPAILLTNSLTSHGAAWPTLAAVGVLFDWLHILGAAIWVGGLMSLALLAPLLTQPGLLKRTVARFSRLAALGHGVLIVTGTAQGIVQVGAWDALLATAYGQALLVKIGLLLLMLVLAVINQRSLSGGRFVRGVRLELALGLVALAVAAVLTGTPPARQLATPAPAALTAEAPVSR
jgi:copper transport protein